MQFSTTYNIRSAYETGLDGTAHHATLVRYAIQVGYLVTQGLGIGNDWLLAQGTTFVVRGMQAEFESAAQGEEALTMTTWLGEVSRFRGARHVRMTSDVDGRVVMNLRLDWVYVNHTTLLPTRFAPDVLARLRVTDDKACQRNWLADKLVGEVYSMRVVPSYQHMDVNKHVNTGVYAEWFEQAFCEATGAQPSIIRGHKFEFVKAAQLGDALLIETQQAGKNVWRQAIKQASTGETLVTNLVLSDGG